MAKKSNNDPQAVDAYLATLPETEREALLSSAETRPNGLTSVMWCWGGGRSPFHGRPAG